jgi:hypothetical protein
MPFASTKCLGAVTAVQVFIASDPLFSVVDTDDFQKLLLMILACKRRNLGTPKPKRWEPSRGTRP